MTDWRPTAARAALEARAATLAQVRAFFATRGVLEVETPCLSAAAASDPHLQSFQVSTPDGPRYLHTSPEFAMKRLLAAGVGDCWQLARVFRVGEAGGRHNPEFSMLEWYRVGWDHTRLIAEVAALLGEVLGTARLGATVVSTYAEVFRAHAGLDPHAADDATLAARVRDLGADPAPLDRDARLDLIAGLAVYPRLGHGRLDVVTDYPASQAALARVRDGSPPVAERFEVFVGGLEVANGYHELTDAAEQAARFARDQVTRAARGLAVLPTDAHLLAALAHGLPACAGVALGFDRLLMLAAGSSDIATVIAFPWQRA